MVLLTKLKEEDCKRLYLVLVGHSDASILGLLWKIYIFFLTLNFLVTQSVQVGRS